MDQSEKAVQFLKMHQENGILVLPNCWDAISAKVMANAGFKAIATASASISWVRGKQDGEGLTADEMVDAIEIICKGVDVPVTADIEKGFGETPVEVEAMVARVLNAGAVGINIEDSVSGGKQCAIDDMQGRIKAARKAGDAAGVKLVINARADGYLLGGQGENVFDDTKNRAAAWIEAGADCIFVPGVGDITLAEKLAGAIDAPLNLLVTDESMPSITALSKAGVARVSTGPRLMQATMGALEKVVSSIGENDDFSFLKNCPSFADLSKL